jgi:type 1 glutamine amidotransferase
VAGVLSPHKTGVPGVNLHCAMHCYRIGNPGTPAQAGTPHAWWFEYLGLQSSSHGPQKPIAITHLNATHPISKGLPDWTTINEELYNNIQVLDGATPLARGKQIVPNKDGTEKEVESIVAWTNTYMGKTRVFSTSIGHNNATVEDDRYLDLVTRGVLWATNNLSEDGTPKPELAK